MAGTLFEQYKAALRAGHQAALDGRLGEALEAYREAGRLVPERALPLASQGTVLHRLNRWGEAIVALDSAIRLAPDDEAALRARATALDERGLSGEAATDYERLAFVLDVAGRAAPAAAAARRAAELAPTPARAALADRLAGRRSAPVPARPVETPAIDEPPPASAGSGDDAEAAAAWAAAAERFAVADAAAAELAALPEDEPAAEDVPSAEDQLAAATIDDDAPLAAAPAPAMAGAEAEDRAEDEEESPFDAFPGLEHEPDLLLALPQAPTPAVAAADAANEPAAVDPRFDEHGEPRADWPGVDLPSLPPAPLEGPAPDPEELIALSTAAVEARDLAGARDLLLTAATVHRQAGRLDAALEVCLRLLEIAPGDPQVHLALANLQLDRGWVDVAKEKMDLLIRLTSLTGDTQAEADVHFLASERLRDDATPAPAAR